MLIEAYRQYVSAQRRFVKKMDKRRKIRRSDRTRRVRTSWNSCLPALGRK
jgi:hypothetical protein